jgi:hypothetical protein
LGLGLDSGAACTRTGLPLADMSCGLEPVRAAAAAAMAMLPRCPIYMHMHMAVLPRYTWTWTWTWRYAYGDIHMAIYILYMAIYMLYMAMLPRCPIACSASVTACMVLTPAWQASSMLT